MGLGDLISILLDNALPLRDLIPTGYLEPHILNCTVDSLQGDVGQNDTNNNGGFVGLQIATQIENCTIQNSDYTVKAASLGGGFGGKLRSGALADAGGGISILGDTELSIDVRKLINIMNAYIPVVKHAGVYSENGFTVAANEIRPDDPLSGSAGGFAGSLEAAVVGSRKGESQISVKGLRSVDGKYYAGGFFGLADVGSVASVSSTGTGSTNILNLIKAGSVDLLDMFRTYVYHSDVNGVPEGMVIRAYASAPEGILSEIRHSGCAGGFGGGMMNGTVKNSDVTNLNTVYAPNYAGGFIGHMGKNGAVDVDDAQVAGPLAGLTAGVLDVFGTVADDCSVTGIDAGAVVMTNEGVQAISGGFVGYADVSQIKNSRVNKLKQVYSDQIAGGFVGKTNMNYLVSAEVDSALVQIVLGIVNGLIRILQVDDLEKLDLLNLDLGILDLKLLTDGDLLYVNLLGLRIGVSLVKSTDPGATNTALITIGDSSIALPYNENGIDTNTENAEVVVNLIKGNRTRVDNCSVAGIAVGYDVYGGGASNTENGTHETGYAGGFVGYNNEGKFTSDTMTYCDVIRGTAQKVGTFSGGTSLQSVYSFNTLESIEKVAGEENHYSVYRNTDSTYALTSGNVTIGTAVADGSGKRFDITHLTAPITPGTNEPYNKIFEKWNGAKLASDASGANAALLRVYVSSAKAVLMLDTPTYSNDESLIPNPGESKDPCGKIDLTVQKIWNDKNNADKSRPEEIRVRIMQHWENEDGTPVTDGGEAKVIPYTDAAVIPDVDTTDGWFTVSKAAHSRAGSATWTRVIHGLPVYTTESDTTYYFSYTVEEAPVVGYSTQITYDESGATATATIRNTPVDFEVQFKYYDRYEINGTPAGIEETETAYSVTVSGIPNDLVTRDASGKVQSIDYAGLIGTAAVEFSNNALAVNNVMCDYDLWTSQGAAVEALSGSSYFYFNNGEHVPYGNGQEYHTDYLSRPMDTTEKWVNYYNSENIALDEGEALTTQCENVRRIVVWCYNYPKLYNVDIFGANSADDLLTKQVGGNTVYVADAASADASVKAINKHKFYYNQRFCEKTGDPYQDDAGFIKNYGLLGYTNVMPSDYAAESFGDYEFAYWAYNQEGTQIASVERNFGYRVTTDTKLYAVYAQAGASNPGISISANTNDTYVDSGGVSKTRLNIFASVFGVPQFDTSVQKLSFVNISLSTQIRDNPKVYTPDKINALFEQYKGQLVDIIDKFDKKQGSKQFSSAETFAGALDPLTGDPDKTLNLTLTTKGYTYTVTSNGNTPGENDATIKLSNKNRAQFTVTYKTSALNLNNTGSNGNTCLVYCGALKYNGTWNISTNCLIYYNGNVVDNTSSVWE